MPVTITPVRAASTIQCPLDGEAGDASDLATTTVQSIANQIKNEQDRVRVGSVASMAAATGVLAGDIWIADDGGIYRAFTVAAGFGDFWEVASTGTAGIYWSHSEWGSTTRANRGIVRYGPMTGEDDATPNGKIPVTHLTNRFVSSRYISGSSLLSETISATQVLVITSHAIAHTPVMVGDILDGLIGPIRLVNLAPSPGNYVYLRIRATDRAYTIGEVQHTVAEVRLDPSQDITITVPFRHVVQSADVGTVTTISLVMYASSVNGMQAIGLDATTFVIGTLTVHRP
jgi:hypothetical protein